MLINKIKRKNISTKFKTRNLIYLNTFKIVDKDCFLKKLYIFNVFCWRFQNLFFFGDKIKTKDLLNFFIFLVFFCQILENIRIRSFKSNLKFFLYDLIQLVNQLKFIVLQVYYLINSDRQQVSDIEIFVLFLFEFNKHLKNLNFIRKYDLIFFSNYKTKINLIKRSTKLKKEKKEVKKNYKIMLFFLFIFIVVVFFCFFVFWPSKSKIIFINSDSVVKQENCFEKHNINCYNNYISFRKAVEIFDNVCDECVLIQVLNKNKK